MKKPTLERLAEARTRKLQLANDRLAADYIDRVRIVQHLDAVLAEARDILDRRLAREWPTAVSSLTVPDAIGYGKRLGDEIRKDLRELATHFEK